MKAPGMDLERHEQTPDQVRRDANAPIRRGLDPLPRVPV